MSILIRGISMPTSCRTCHLKINCDDCEGLECFCLPLKTQIGYLKDLLTDKRRDDCPLVPVPPHGRLIDADALPWIEGKDEQDNPVYLLIKNCVDALPTIIPASEEGE